MKNVIKEVSKKKLSLNKKTISHLDELSQGRIIGGVLATADAASSCTLPLAGGCPESLICTV